MSYTSWPFVFPFPHSFDCVNHNKLWKILKEHLTCLLRNLCAGQEARVRTGHERTDWFQTGEGVRQGCILSSWLFDFYTEYMMWNARLDEAQAWTKIAGRNINLKHADDTTLMVESEEEVKSFLKRVKEESEKTGLKLSIQKTKIMASSPITSWQLEGKKVEAVTDFMFLGSRITVDSDWTHEIKRPLFLGKEALTSLDIILESRDITLPTKVCIVKAVVFPVVMYGCESWTIRKAECWGTEAFKLWCWRRLLRVPWTARRSNQSIWKEVNHEYSLEGLLLKLQYFGHLMRKADSLEKTLMLGKVEVKRRGCRGWDG